MSPLSVSSVQSSTPSPRALLPSQSQPSLHQPNTGSHFHGDGSGASRSRSHSNPKIVRRRGREVSNHKQQQGAPNRSKQRPRSDDTTDVTSETTDDEAVLTARNNNVTFDLHSIAQSLVPEAVIAPVTSSSTRSRRYSQPESRQPVSRADSAYHRSHSDFNVVNESYYEPDYRRTKSSVDDVSGCDPRHATLCASKHSRKPNHADSHNKNFVWNQEYNHIQRPRSGANTKAASQVRPSERDAQRRPGYHRALAVEPPPPAQDSRVRNPSVNIHGGYDKWRWKEKKKTTPHDF